MVEVEDHEGVAARLLLSEQRDVPTVVLPVDPSDASRVLVDKGIWFRQGIPAGGQEKLFRRALDAAGPSDGWRVVPAGVFPRTGFPDPCAAAIWSGILAERKQDWSPPGPVRAVMTLHRLAVSMAYDSIPPSAMLPDPEEHGGRFWTVLALEAVEPSPGQAVVVLGEPALVSGSPVPFDSRRRELASAWKHVARPRTDAKNRSIRPRGEIPPAALQAHSRFAAYGCTAPDSLAFPGWISGIRKSIARILLHKQDRVGWANHWAMSLRGHGFGVDWLS
jgi:hypothetical protein